MKLNFYCLAMLVAAYLNVNAQTIPAFSEANPYTATYLVSTYGDTMRMTPSSPNNYHQVESHIFVLPTKAQGISAIRFGLHGADGGTATFTESGGQQFKANGGGGSTVWLTIKLDDDMTIFKDNPGGGGSTVYYPNKYGLPFFVTIGKNGQSGTGYLVSTAGGGGGSTGMAWLIPGFYYENYIGGGQMRNAGPNIAIAAGGGGGEILNANVSAAGGGGGVTSGTTDLFQIGSSSCPPYSVQVAAGSSVLNDNQNDRGTTDPCLWTAVSESQNVTQASTTQLVCIVCDTSNHNAMLALTNFTLGQPGGSPCEWTGGPPIYNNAVQSLGCGGDNIVNHGNAGGSGFTGGGAGSAAFTGWTSWVGGGGGGTGTDEYGTGGYIYVGPFNQTVVQSYGGGSYDAGFGHDVAYIGGGQVGTPASGWFEYYTIPDTIRPVVQYKHDTVYLDQNGQVNITTQNIGGISDNDSVASVMFTPHHFDCNGVGTYPLRVVATDFAGNTTVAWDTITVLNNRPPYMAQGSLHYIPVKYVDIASGSYTVSRSDFPTFYATCYDTSQLTYTWTPTTFSCPENNSTQTVNVTVTEPNGNSTTFAQSYYVYDSYAPQTIYVDASASGANTGSDWQNAYTDLQSALNKGCNSGRTIYVAQGTYYPDRGYGVTTGDRSASFTLRDGDKIYGGFPTGGDVFSNRNPSAHPVYLSGEIGTAAQSDNSYSVVTIPGSSANTHIEGVHITGGYGNQSGNSGGAVHIVSTDAVIRERAAFVKCTLNDNYSFNGGAVSFTDAAATGTISFSNCLFSNNHVGSLALGGAIYVNGSGQLATGIDITNSAFIGNRGGQGGALYYSGTKGNITNVSFSTNYATAQGGALYVSGVGQLINIYNTVMYGDTGIFPSNEIYESPASEYIYYSDIQGSGGSGSWNSNIGTDGGNNLDVDPQFLANQNLQVALSSPLHNAGNAAYNTTLRDLADAPRLTQDTMDIGAYETTSIVYVAWDAPNGGDGTSWASAFNQIQDGLDATYVQNRYKDVWVKGGTYYPTKNYYGLANQGRFNTIVVSRSQRLYGGFAGNETSLTERNVPLHPTILSGDLGTQGNRSDNAFHVVTINSAINARIDGIIIQDGNADSTVSGYQFGGAVECTGSGTLYPNTTFANCSFRNNNSAGGGGAIDCNASPTFQYALTFRQSIFYNNTTDGNGGAVYINNTGGTGNNVICNFYNCTATANRATGSGAFAASRCSLLTTDTATVNVYNTILYGDTGGSGEYTSVRGIGFIHAYNSDVNLPNPLFVNAANPAGADGNLFTADDGLKLQPSSPGINAGNNAYLSTGDLNDSLYDVTGAARVQQSVVNMGPYEDWGCLGYTSLYVDSSIAVAGLGNSWATALSSLQDAVHTAYICPQVDTIYVAQGTYYPGPTENLISQDTTFLIGKRLTILGGYPTGGGVRNVNTHPVVLDGSINLPNVVDNAYHVMTIVDATATDTVRLDGLTFKRGNAFGVGYNTLGGHSFSRGAGAGIVIYGPVVTISNCNFINDQAQSGGAISDYSGTLVVSNSVFTSNLGINGGAIRTEPGCKLIATANTFYNNISSASGGALSTNMGSADTTTLVNNQFIGNQANNYGGAAVLDGGAGYVYNNTFYHNIASVYAGGLYLMPGSTTSVVSLFNNIFYGDTGRIGNSEIYNSTVNTTLTQSNNGIGINPVFYNEGNLIGADNLWGTNDDGLELQNASTLINQGNGSIVNYNTDITGAPRVKLGAVDIGAFEADSVVTRWYVSAAQDSVTGDGLSWATAFAQFTQGLNAAKPGDSVWVAGGIYSPDTGTSFHMKSGVQIYGGFNATESELSQRALSTGFNSILQGSGSNVIINDSVNSAAVLDGFIIQYGAGGAGAGMANSHSSPQVRNCVFTNNSASNVGGAVSCSNSSPVFTNVIFYHNSVTGVTSSGGAVYCANNSYPVIRNCDFVNNTSTFNSGAINSLSNAHPSVSNSAFTGNTAVNLYDDYFFAGTAALSHNLLQTGSNTSGNIISTEAGMYNQANGAGPDGLWFTADDGFQLNYGTSNLVNHGTNDSVINTTTDVLGLSRIQNGTVDIGAYESPFYSYCDSAAFNSVHVLYVDGAQPNSGDGYSWASAFTTLGEALDKANYCTAFDTILVAAGTYYPTGYQADTNRNLSFNFLRSGYAVIGGYPHGGGVRNAGSNNTVLSGNIGQADTNIDNSYHVLVFRNTDNTTNLNGFIITGGSANSTIGDANGNGGGAWINGSGTAGNCKPHISNCVFTGNYAYYGGAVFNDGQLAGNSSPTFINCVFTKNTSDGLGGAIYNFADYNGVASPVITNCTFAGNSCSNNGGGIYNTCQPSGNVSATLKNTILWGNTSNDGLADQQFTGDGCASTISYSIVQGGLSGSLIDGGHNLYASPQFVDSVSVSGYNNQWMTNADGLDIYAGSPAIDAGNPLNAPTTDITGAARVGTPDIGAYENVCSGTVVKALTIQSCDSVVSPNYSRWLTASGVYSDTAITRTGCDTIFNLNLTLGHTTTDTLNVNACNAFTSPSGNYVWDSTGTYTDVLPNSSGCDSIVTVNLTVNGSAASAFSASTCDPSYTYNGHVYTLSGVYNDTLLTQQGCDSIVVLTLTLETINNSASVTGALCTASETGAVSYQWINCSTQQPIGGATSQSYTATQNGNYACVVTKGSCTDTTNCVAVTSLNIDGISSYNFSVYPNPNNGNFVIQHNYNGFITAKLVNALGQEVKEFALSSSVTHININDLAAGVYQLRLNDKNETLSVIKVVKQ